MSSTAELIEIVPMRRRHIRTVASIEETNQRNPWSSAVFTKELSLGDQRHYVVATMGTQVIGFGGLFFSDDDAHVTNLSVLGAMHRRGVASRIMMALVDHALGRGITGLTLEVRAGNTAAKALYRRFGLAPAGIRRAYYKPDDEDALIMWAHDIDGPEYRARLDDLRDVLDAASPFDAELETLR